VENTLFIDLNGTGMVLLFIVGVVGAMVSGFIGSGGAFVLTPAIVLFSGFFYIPSYLSTLGMIEPLSDGTMAPLKAVGDGTLALALAVGGITIVLAIVKGIAEHRHQHAELATAEGYE
jgi:hypothetical protein